MTSRERLINSYAKLVFEGKCSLDSVPLVIRNAVALKVAEMTENN